ncbi:protein FAM200B [Ascaphus truei]|uniref:protein FAM200B n=1 Tax=Ascaphus truei TaxID=8439 RepID=UPI003F5992D7
MDKWLLKAAVNATTATSSDDGPSKKVQKLHNIAENTKTTESPNVQMESLSSKRRKYKDEYLKLGFSWTMVNHEQRPQCVLCSEILANDSMKPNKLTRHLVTKHPEYKDKDIAFFKRHEESQKASASVMNKYVTVSSKAQRASYVVSELIARTMKPYNIGETLVLPAAIKMCEIMHGSKYAEALKSIPLSRDTVKRRIIDLSKDIEIQLLMQIQQSVKFAIQLDESTDIGNMAQLLVFVRYCYEGEILEEMLFCKSLEGHTTGEDIFSVVEEFFKANDLLWHNCVGVCTDGAAAMMGHKKGFRAKVLSIAPHVKFTHCMIHREALAAKKLEPEANEVLNDAIKIVNFIKARPLQSRLFSIFCNEMGSQYDSLLLHTEVRWLSRGKILRRVFEFKDELQLYLSDHNPTLAAKFCNERWLQILCYLSDIFEKMNDLNSSLQGKNSNILSMGDKISTFLQKLTLWKHKYEAGSCEMFQCLSEFIEASNANPREIDSVIKTHLENLHQNLSERFRDLQTGELHWIGNPFDTDVGSTHLPLTDQEKLIELSNDSTLKIEFKKKSLTSFWVTMKREYPDISAKAIDVLLPFPSTYLCEATFSKLATLKSKNRSRLDVEPELRVAVSGISPRMDVLTAGAQAHPSH